MKIDHFALKKGLEKIDNIIAAINGADLSSYILIAFEKVVLGQPLNQVKDHNIITLPLWIHPYHSSFFNTKFLVFF